MESDLTQFRAFVDEHQRAVRAFVTARIDDPFEAQDLAQEVFLVAFRKLDEIDRGRPLRPWLYGIAGNLVRNHRRKLGSGLLRASGGDLRAVLDEEIESQSTWREPGVLDALKQCLAQLEGRAQELIRLRYDEGLGISQIRATLGGQHSGITMKLHRLRERLRECIERRIRGTCDG